MSLPLPLEEDLVGSEAKVEKAPTSKFSSTSGLKRTRSCNEESMLVEAKRRSFHGEEGIEEIEEEKGDGEEEEHNISFDLSFIKNV